MHNKRREGWSITPTLTLGLSGHVAVDNRGAGTILSGDPALEQPWMVGSVWGYPRGNSLVWGNRSGAMVLPPWRWRSAERV